MVDIVIGIGGTGGYTQRIIKYNSKLFRRSEDGQLRHIYMDTLTKDHVNQPNEEGNSDAGGFTPTTALEIRQNEYIELEGKDLHRLAMRLASGEEVPQRSRYSWWQAQKFIEDLHVNPRVFELSEGAGQYRQFGRIGVHHNIDQIWNSFNTIISSVAKRVPINFFICCSLVGGTGSGALIDIGIILRHLGLAQERNVQIFLVLALEGAFLDLKGQEEFKHTPERAFAVLREIHRLQLAPSPAIPLVVKYPGSNVRKAEVKTQVFDGVFLADVPLIEGTEGRSARHQHLFPAMADLVEIFTEPNTAKEIAQNTVNASRVVTAIMNHQKLDQAETEGVPIDELRKRPSYEPRFSSFAFHRIVYPKQLYLSKFGYQIAHRFVEELLKPLPASNKLQDNLRDGVELNDADLEKRVRTEAVQLLQNIVSSESTLLSAFPLDHLLGMNPDVTSTGLDEVKMEFRNLSATDILKQLTPGDETERTKRELIDPSLDRYEDLCTGKTDERQLILTNIKNFKTELHGPPDKLEPGSQASGTMHRWLSDFNERMVRQAAKNCVGEVLSRLNGPTPTAKRGRLGALKKVLDCALEEYLSALLGEIKARQELIKGAWNQRNSEAQEKLRTVGTVARGRRIIGSDLKDAQQAYLKAEIDLLAETKRLVGNAYMLKTLGEIKALLQHWHDEISSWGHDAAIKTGTNSFAKLEDGVNRTNGELVWLAQNPNVSIGIEDTDGEDAISMGGFDAHLYQRLNVDTEVIDNWLESAEWQIEDGSKPEKPGSLALRLFSTGEAVRSGDKLDEPLYEQARRTCEAELEATGIFDYLLDFLPNREEKPLTIEKLADRLAGIFDDKKLMVETADKPPWILSWLFFNSSGKNAERQLIDAICKEMPSRGNRFDAPIPLEKYEAEEVLGYARMAHGIALGTCTTTDLYAQDYMKSINETDWMLDIYHICEEEQVASWAERHLFESSLKMESLIPGQIRAALSKRERVPLFLELFALGAIDLSDEGQFLLQTSRPQKTHSSRGSDPFVLAEKDHLFDAFFTFVTEGKDRNPLARQKDLPPLAELISLKEMFIQQYVEDEQKTTQEVLLECLERLSGALHEIPEDSDFFVVRDNYPKLSKAYRELTILWIGHLIKQLDKKRETYSILKKKLKRK